MQVGWVPCFRTKEWTGQKKEGLLQPFREPKCMERLISGVIAQKILLSNLGQVDIASCTDYTIMFLYSTNSRWPLQHLSWLMSSVLLFGHCITYGLKSFPMKESEIHLSKRNKCFGPNTALQELNVKDKQWHTYNTAVFKNKPI